MSGSVTSASDPNLIATRQHGRILVVSVAFSLNGKRLVSGSDGGILLWDTETWKSTSRIGRPSVLCICLSRDGTRIASGSYDGTIIIWDAETACKVAGPFRGHTVPVSSVTFSIDGKHVISGPSNGTIRVWDVETGKTICVLQGDTLYVHSLALSPDGCRIASGSSDNMIRVWDLSGLPQPSMESSSDIVFKTASSLDDRDSSDWAFQRDGWILSGPDRHDIHSDGESTYGSDEESTHDSGGESMQDSADEPASGHDQRNLLLWIPPDLRATLWRPRNTGISSCDFYTKLDFSDAALGERWMECFVAPIRQ